MNADEPAAVGEEGRIAVDQANSPLAWFKGYINEPTKSAEKFSSDGRWYLTGDLGRVDEDGYFFFASRADDLIIMAGYRISPAEVESVILTHPAVMECAAVAVADEVRGEVLEAAVVLRSKHEPTEALTAELQAWVKERYAAHAYPRRVHYVESLPKTLSGKLQRFRVREQLRDSLKYRQ
jgi:acetyl-CoA synthetase